MVVISLIEEKATGPIIIEKRVFLDDELASIRALLLRLSTEIKKHQVVLIERT